MRALAAVAVAVGIAGSAIAAQRGTASATPAAPAIAFTNRASAAGIDFVHTNGASADKYLVETMGSGAALLDADDDGWLDLFLVDGGRAGVAVTRSATGTAPAGAPQHRLYRNLKNGRFADVTAASGIRHSGYGMGACAGDVDNDGRIDLYVTNYGPNTLYRNAGGGAFVDVTRAAGVGLPVWSTSCGFVDVDRDNDLDLFVANYLDVPRDRSQFCGDPQRRIRVYCHPLNHTGLASVLYRNDGTGVFTDISAEAGIAAHIGNGLGVAVGDYDGDGWADVFVANDAVPNFLFHNEGRGKFIEAGLPAGVAVARDGRPRAGMGTEFADYNGDGRLDLVVTNHEFETHSLFRNDGGGIFTDATVESGLGPPTLPYVGFGVALFDADNDADLDLSILNGHVIDNTALFRSGSTHAQPKLLLRNTTGRLAGPAGPGLRRFEDISRQSGPGFAMPGVGRSLIAGDLDNDGDIDLVATNNGAAPELLINGGSRRPALIVRLVVAGGSTGGNRDAIGARVTATASGRAQMREVRSGSSYLGQGDLRVHFGLGDADRVERLEIRWPGGAVETLTDIAAGQIVTVTQGRGISSRRPFQ
jgi:hypothetical protein